MDTSLDENNIKNLGDTVKAFIFIALVAIGLCITSCTKPFSLEVELGKPIFASEYGLEPNQTVEELVALTAGRLRQTSTGGGPSSDAKRNTPEYELLERIQWHIENWNHESKSFFTNVQAPLDGYSNNSLISIAANHGFLESEGGVTELTPQGKQAEEKGLLHVLTFNGRQTLNCITSVRLLKVSKVVADSNNHITVDLEYSWVSTELGHQLFQYYSNKIKIVDSASGTAIIRVNEAGGFTLETVNLKEPSE
jgi:hypothetical protein